MNMTIDMNGIEGRTEVHISGEIDVYTSPQLKNALIPLSEQREEELIIDLSNVTYMDSTGLGILVMVFKNKKANGGHLSLTGLSGRLQRLFTITGLSEIMDIKSKLEGGTE